jgi:hypothetical protein
MSCVWVVPRAVGFQVAVQGSVTIRSLACEETLARREDSSREAVPLCSCSDQARANSGFLGEKEASPHTWHIVSSSASWNGTSLGAFGCGTVLSVGAEVCIGLWVVQRAKWNPGLEPCWTQSNGCRHFWQQDPEKWQEAREHRDRAKNSWKIPNAAVGECAVPHLFPQLLLSAVLWASVSPLLICTLRASDTPSRTGTLMPLGELLCPLLQRQCLAWDRLRSVRVWELFSGRLLGPSEVWLLMAMTGCVSAG